MDATPSPQAKPAPISNERYQRLRGEQNLSVALLAGIVAAVIGGIAWAIVTVTTEYQIGYMAIAVGFVVGFAVRLGKGVDKTFGILGAVLALLGCVLGNVFSLIGFISKEQHMGIGAVLSGLDYSKLPQMMSATFSAMDLLFYGIAVYEGYRFSFRRLTPEDLGLGQSSAK